MARPTPRALVILLLFAAPFVTPAIRAATPDLAAARQLADALRSTFLGAAAPAGFTASAADAAHLSLGVNLADYANNPGTDPAQFENTVDTARRILAGGNATKRAPDATSRWLDDSADTLLAVVRAAEAAADPARDPKREADLVELRACALLGRYHARRLLAAVHYNLFKRGLRLAELVAATYGEKDAVAVWRELVATCGSHPFAPQWRAELKKLQWSLKELEDQCCPPDESTLKEKVWVPAARTAALTH